MDSIHYVGMDVHKKFVQFCVKDLSGKIEQKGRVDSRHTALKQWASQLPRPWVGGLEATMFSAWIHDVIRPFAARLEVGNPGRMKAIWAGKNKNDEWNAEQIAGLVRANLMPKVYVPSPELRQLRDVLRFRSGLVGDCTQMKNRMSGLLLQYGAEFERALAPEGLLW